MAELVLLVDGVVVNREVRHKVRGDSRSDGEAARLDRLKKCTCVDSLWRRHACSPPEYYSIDFRMAWSSYE